MTSPLYPGATIGILGSGQLGRMLAIAARQMGYRVHTLSPDRDTPTGQIADKEIVAAYDDLEAVADFARAVDVVTFEFENVSAEATGAAARYAPVRPDGQALHTTQNRLREKRFLERNGFPLGAFCEVTARADLDSLRPGVLKTAGFGYDGKGQRLIRTPEDADAAWAALGNSPCLLEAFVDFECELSVVAARGIEGAFAHYGPVRNEHSRHILDVTTAPAPGIAPRIATEAVEIARGVMEALGVVGVLCVEFFLTRQGTLLVNELAPRPHNSGHWTIEGCAASQFEQQLRAVCGLPLGSTEQRLPGAALANLLGDLWTNERPPDWSAALALPKVHLHLYGKADPRPGRKMGHLTALADTPEQAAQQVRRARQALLSEQE